MKDVKPHESTAADGAEQLPTKNAPRRKPGRPRKNKQGKASTLYQTGPSGAFERIQPAIRIESKKWLEEQAARHWSSMGQVIDDIVACLRENRPVEIKTYMPKYMVLAKKAELKRQARLEALKKKHEQNPYQDTPDDGSERDF